MPQVGELSVLFTGNDAKLTAVTAHAQQSLMRFASQARGALAVAGAALGFAGVAAAVKSFVHAAAEQEVAEKKLETALGRTSQALLDQATALQKVTTSSDEQIVAAQASIAAFTGDEDRIKALTKASLDFAAAQGIDVVSAAQLLAKTLGSDMNALGRYGVKVEGAANSTQRFDEIVKGISIKFGGQAQAATQTFSGRVEVLKNKFGEVAEDLGRKLIPSLERLLGVLDANSEKIGNSAGALIDFVTQHKEAIGAVTLLAGALKTLGISLLGTEGIITKVAKALGLLTPMGLALTALGIAAAGLINELNRGPDAAAKFGDAMSEAAARITGDVTTIETQAAKVFEVLRALSDARKEEAAAKTASGRAEAINAEIAATQKLIELSKQHDIKMAEDARPKGWLHALEPTIARQSPETDNLEKRLAALQSKATQNQERVVIEKIAARTPGFDAIIASFDKGLDARKNAVGKFLDTTLDSFKKFLDARTDLLQKVRMFGMEGLDAAIANIEQARDDLMKEAAKIGQLTPALAAEINKKAADQVGKAKTEANQNFQNKLGGFGGDQAQQNVQAIQQVIQERDALIKEAESLGLLTDALRAQINARAEQAAVGAVKPMATPQFVGIQEAWKKLQQSIFESEAQKEALLLARAQLAAVQAAAKKRDEIAAEAKRTADGIDKLVKMGGSQAVFGN